MKSTGVIGHQRLHSDCLFGVFEGIEAAQKKKKEWLTPPLKSFTQRVYRAACKSYPYSKKKRWENCRQTEWKANRKRIYFSVEYHTQL